MEALRVALAVMLLAGGAAAAQTPPPSAAPARPAAPAPPAAGTTAADAAIQASQVRPPLLVLDLEARGGGVPEAQAATINVVRGLRDLDVFQVLSADDVRQLLALERTRQLSGAKGESALGELGKALGANNAVVGSLTRVGGRFQVEIRLLDAGTQKVLNQKTLGPVSTVTEIASALPGLSQELVAPLLKDQQGYLLVRTRDEAAEVLVDDTLVGSTPLKAPITLSRGLHRLQVRKDGFIAQTRSVRIEPNQTRVEDVALVPSPDYAATYQDKYGRMRVGAWIATGVAVVGISASIWLYVAAQDQYNNDFYPRQQWLYGANGGSQTKPPSVASNPTASANWDQCTKNGAQYCYTQAQSSQSSIRTLQWVTAGTVVIAAAATGVAVWLWVAGKDPNRYADVVAGVGPTPSGGAAFALAGRF
ncbi:MAG TPA: PEGA domain-containing protein [Myxococcaceae bacterium]|nr:PEGA domain-containing protein [Myxococcaceae bacterium]